ncbi:Aminoglycoside phosphotransferase [gamma proteobacterium HdN1]|nr:Aminoglycoside phosphotransferase [gamma proteobacterium HdN1]
MSDELEEYARLSPEDVILAVESVGFLSDARILALNSYENRVYQVGIEESDPMVAKFYRPSRWTDAQILEEHAFVAALVDAEIPVVAPWVKAGSGADGAGSLHHYQGYRFALFPRKGGQAPEPGDLDQLYRIGMLLGRMHAVGRKQEFSVRPRLSLERYLETPIAAVCRDGFLPATLCDRYRKITDTLRIKLNALPWEAVQWIRTHGDCHAGNVLWTRDDGPWLVDFDDCQSAPAVQDLWMMLTSSRLEQELQLAELLEGYSTFCEFDRREIALIEGLRSLRMVHYAGWLASRWHDPAFPRHFPWFNTQQYWQQHLAELELQCLQLDEEPLRCLG